MGLNNFINISLSVISHHKSDCKGIVFLSIGKWVILVVFGVISVLKVAKKASVAFKIA